MNSWSTNVSAVLLTYAAHSTLLLCAALLLERWWVRASAGRDLLWKLAAFGGLLTVPLQLVVSSFEPAAAPLSVRWEIPRPVTAVPQAEVVEAELVEANPAEPASAHGAPASLSTAAVPVRESPRELRIPAWQTLLTGAWLLGLCLMLLRLRLRFARARARFAGRTPETDDANFAALRLVQRRMGVRFDIRLTRASAVGSPVALGGGEICLPAELSATLTAEQRQSLLAHELAHLVRRDPRWLIAFAWLEAICFFQPLNVLARRRFLHAAEELCDQHALRCTSALALAQCLAEVARWVRERPAGLPLATMGDAPAPLLARVQRVLHGRVEAIALSRRAFAGAWLALAAFGSSAPVITVAAGLPAPLQSAEPEDTASAVSTAAFAALRGGAENQPPPSALRRDRPPPPPPPPPPARQQQASLEQRVAAAPDGIVHIAYDASDEVCGSGIDTDGAGMFAILPSGRWRSMGADGQAELFSFDRDDFSRLSLQPNDSWTQRCQRGPAHVLLAVRSGRVTNVQLAVGEPLRTRIDTDLGVAAAAQVVPYLLSLAGRAEESVATAAILAAVLSAQPSRQRIRGAAVLERNLVVGEAQNSPLRDGLLAIATNSTRPDAVRETALHWLVRDPGPGTAELIRNYADRLPRADNDRPSGEPPRRSSMGEYNARIRLGGLSLEDAIRVVIDEKQSMATRQHALTWVEDNSTSDGILAGLYDHIRSRELRHYLLHYLAACDNEATARKLIAIAERDPDVDARQIARAALRQHQNAVARAAR